jgi:ditrans,polycis-polyprenyl diphosphate synthase
MGSLHDSRIHKWFATSPPVAWTFRQLRELLIGSLKQGPIPQHVAFVMDGNRRFARNHHIETVEGHNLGFESLARVRQVDFRLSVNSANASLDPRSLLQDRSQGRDHIRIQHRKLQALEA